MYHRVPWQTMGPGECSMRSPSTRWAHNCQEASSSYLAVWRSSFHQRLKKFVELKDVIEYTNAICCRFNVNTRANQLSVTITNYLRQVDL
jgi:hypothetical protein